MGLERIALLMEQLQEKELPVEQMDIFIAALGQEPLTTCAKLTHALRLQGIKAAIDYSGRSLKAQLKQASRVNARYTLIVGDDELAKQQAILRNMASQEQNPFDLSGSSAQQSERLRSLLKETTDPA